MIEVNFYDPVCKHSFARTRFAFGSAFKDSESSCFFKHLLCAILGGLILAASVALSSPSTGRAQSVSIAPSDPESEIDDPLSSTREVVVFSARSNEPGFFRRVWRTDGTPGGTFEITRDYAAPDHFFSLGDGRAAFVGIRCFRYNIGVVNSRRVRHIPITTDATLGQPASGFARFDAENVIFNGYSQEHGYEPWISPLRNRGTKMVRDIYLGSASSFPTNFTPLGDGRFVFIATDAAHRTELWVTDGTRRGTKLTKDLVPPSSGGGGNTIRYLTSLGDGRALFNGQTPQFRSRLFVTDGTQRGTKELVAREGLVVDPRNIVAIGDGRAFLNASRDSSVVGTWTTDGTPRGTKPLLKRGEPISLGNFTPMGEGRFLASQYLNEALYLWETDGTPSGTNRITRVAHMVGDARFAAISQPVGDGAGNFYFFVTVDRQPEPRIRQLWVTDGTSDGTRRVVQFPTDHFETSALVPVGRGRMVFGMESPATGNELWVTNGTGPGTTLLMDIYPGATSSNPEGFVNLFRP